MKPLMRKLILLAGLTIALGVAILPPSASITQAAPRNGFIGAYRIRRFQNSVQVLDATGCSPNGGTPIQLWKYWGGDCQQWFIQPTTPGYFKIMSKNGGRVLDAMGCSANAGTHIQLWDYWGGDCQQWRIEPIDEDGRRYTIMSKNGGRALDVTGCSSDGGAPIQLWDYWGGSCQQWVIEPVTAPKTLLAHPDPLTTGSCQMSFVRAQFDSDGRGSFIARTLTRSKRAKVRVSIDVKDVGGFTIFSVGSWDSPAMQGRNVGTSVPPEFHVSFTYNPAFFAIINDGTIHSECVRLD